jgi:hypothetical protein
MKDEWTAALSLAVSLHYCQVSRLRIQTGLSPQYVVVGERRPSSVDKRQVRKARQLRQSLSPACKAGNAHVGDTTSRALLPGSHHEQQAQIQAPWSRERPSP